MPRLFVFGLGYSATAVAQGARASGWEAAGTTRNREKALALARSGIEAVLLERPDGEQTDGDKAVEAALTGRTHLLASAAPREEGDPLLRRHAAAIRCQAGSLRWIGYLSSVSVYGDRKGAWVEESSEALPSSAVGRRRLEAEAAWRALGRDLGLPVAVFRLAGIYGPGRNLLRDLKTGRARRVVKEGQVFNRIHVEDIAGAVLAAMKRPEQAGIFNLADREPAAQSQVVLEAARLLGVAPPPETAVEEADLSPMARRFWSENRRVSAERLGRDLGYSLRYPSYREGLAGLLAGEP